MYKTNKRFVIQAVFLTWAACLLTGSYQSLAEEITRGFQPSAYVKLQRKTPDAVLSSHMRFLITAQTRVLDLRGKEIPILSLPVPCYAKVTYRPVNYSDPEALKIVVTQVLPEATTDWTSPSLSE